MNKQDYKRFYEETKYILTKYQDEIMPGFRREIENMEAELKNGASVVKCRDCKHNADNGGDCNRTITFEGRDYVLEMNTYSYVGLEFCSYGERKD